MIKKLLFSLCLLIIASISVGISSVSSFNYADDGLDFVYGTNHFDGNLISSTFIPPAITEMYLIADQINVLSARFTDVYYWPITNEYRADWNKANIVIEGELEIIKDGEIYDIVTIDYYVRQFDALDQQNTSRFFFGNEAIIAREEFELRQSQYRQDLFNYHQLMNEYRKEFQQALADLQAGLITEDQIPERPEAFDEFTLFSTELLRGFQLNLPSGRYSIQFRTSSGEVIPQSRKNLIVFSHLREGVGFKIIPEDRWTAPEFSQDNTEVIYTLRDKTFYLEPFLQKQYNQLYYVRMNNPQDTLARSDHTIWVAHRPAENVNLRINSAFGTVEQEMSQFNVQQLPGPRLGYEIIEFDPEVMNQPTFRGFKFSVSGGYSRFTIVLIDSNNQIIPGGGRDIHVLFIERRNVLYLFPAIPVLIGIVIVVLRKKNVKNIKVSGAG